MNGSGELEPIGGGYSLEITFSEDDGGWYGVIVDSNGADKWDIDKDGGLFDSADAVRAAARAVADKVGAIE